MRIDSMDAVNRLQDPRISAKEFMPDTADKAVEIKPVLQNNELGGKEFKISDKAVMDAIERVNRAISGTYRQFEFSIHKKTNQIMVKVINTETKEVIREIPPEKMLDMVAQIWEMAGILVDERR